MKNYRNTTIRNINYVVQEILKTERTLFYQRKVDSIQFNGSTQILPFISRMLTQYKKTI